MKKWSVHNIMKSDMKLEHSHFQVEAVCSNGVYESLQGEIERDIASHGIIIIPTSK